MEKLEDQFITSCETVLSKEGKEICKEIDQLIKDDKKFDIDKARTYCSFFYRLKKILWKKNYMKDVKSI